MGPRPRCGRGTARSALAVAGLLRGDQRGDNAPWDGDAAAELAESRRGADDHTEPASADVPAAGGHVNTHELIAAQFGDRLRSGYAGERGDDGSLRGQPPRRDRPLRGGERVHDPQSRKCGVSTISESEAIGPGAAEGAINDQVVLDSRTTTCGGPDRTHNIIPATTRGAEITRTG